MKASVHYPGRSVNPSEYGLPPVRARGKGPQKSTEAMPQPVRQVEIPKPGGVRKLGIPTVMDCTGDYHAWFFKVTTSFGRVNNSGEWPRQFLTGSPAPDPAGSIHQILVEVIPSPIPKNFSPVHSKPAANARSPAVSAIVANIRFSSAPSSPSGCWRFHTRTVANNLSVSV